MRQTNIKNLNKLSWDKMFEFQKEIIRKSIHNLNL